MSVACAEIVWMYFEGSNKEYDTVAVATAASCFALATISGVAVNRYKGLARSSQTDAEYASHFYNMHRAWLVFNTALCVPTIMSCYVLIFAEIASRFAEPPAGVSSGLIIACVLIAMVYNASLTLGRTTLDLTAQEQDDIEHTSTTVQACLGIPVATTLIGVMIGALVEGEFSKKAIEHGVGYGIVVCLALAAIYAGAKLMTPCLSNTISWMRGRTSQANGPNEEMRLLQHVAAPIN